MTVRVPSHALRTCGTALCILVALVLTASAFADDEPTCPDAHDSVETACQVDSGTTLQDYLAQPGTRNDYQIETADPNTRVQIDLTDLPADYDLYLFDDARDLVAQSVSEDLTPESIDTVVADPGTYFVVVAVDQSVQPAPDQPYTLAIILSPAAPPEPAPQPAGTGGPWSVVVASINAVDVAVAPDHTVYALDQARSTVLRVTPGGATLQVWGGAGNKLGQLQVPSGIWIGGTDGVFVADSGNRRVQRFSFTGEARQQYASGVNPWTGGTVSAVDHPVRTAVDGNGNVYVADPAHGRVVRLTPAGAPVGVISVGDPEGLAIDPRGNLLVADSQSNRIARFSPTGQPLSSFEGALSGPRGVAADRAGNVYVADTHNDRIVQFSPAGQVVAQWGGSGEAPGQFHGPLGVAVDADGSLYVADTGNQRVLRLASEGR